MFHVKHLLGGFAFEQKGGVYTNLGIPGEMGGSLLQSAGALFFPPESISRVGRYARKPAAIRIAPKRRPFIPRMVSCSPRTTDRISKSDGQTPSRTAPRIPPWTWNGRASSGSRMRR